jgi:hypothetical protein
MKGKEKKRKHTIKMKIEKGNKKNNKILQKKENKK